MGIKREIHRRLNNKFGKYNKDAQYTFIKLHTGRNHVADLNIPMCKQLLIKLPDCRRVTGETWKRLGK